jgi:glycosyltransferase involved in cell wall biosynthesis
MRVLFVLSRFPLPPWRGDAVRAFQQVRYLGGRHEITLVAPGPERRGRADSSALESLSRLARLELIPVPAFQRWANLMRAAWTALPLQTLYYYAPAIDRALRRLTSAAKYDLAHVQMVRMGPACETLGPLPWVMDMVDTASLNMRRRASRETPWAKPLVLVEARRLAAYERELMARSNWVLVTSPADLEALGERRNASVIPIGVDLEAFPFVDQGREAGTIVFTGRMAYFPNADAAVYFAREVFPLVRRVAPSATFEIVGVSPPPRVRSLRRIPGVRVIPDPELRPYLARAAVAVAPLRSGTGIQIKVLEAMASGVPVVGTPIVSPAIGAHEGEHWFLADSAELMAEKVVQLLQDRRLARTMAASAHRFVEEHHTWEAAAHQLEAIWSKVLQQVAER